MPWDKGECLVAVVAYDGVEGQKLIRNVRPNLIITDISISEEVGFIDIGHFSRVFKNFEGCSANEYRNKLSS